MMDARRAYLEIRYNNDDISKHIEPYIKSWSFTDNLDGQADDLQIILQDRERIWIKKWMPRKGATLKANIVRNNWMYWGQIERAILGIFDVDEIEMSGPPSEVNLKGISVPVTTSLSGEPKNRAWEKVRLKVILQDIANKNKLKLFYDSNDNPEYDRIEQTEQTDLQFMMKLCSDAGLCLKVSNESIVVFDEEKYESNEAILSIKREDDGSIPLINTKTNAKLSYVKSYNGRTTLTGAYKACRVEYQDGESKKKITSTFTPSNPPKTERILVINERVSSIAEAQRLAKKKLRQENKETTTMSITLVGDLNLFAGRTILIEGFGEFDGKYLITQATHSQQNGYEVKIEIRKCLEGY